MKECVCVCVFLRRTASLSAVLPLPTSLSACLNTGYRLQRWRGENVSTLLQIKRDECKQDIFRSDVCETVLVAVAPKCPPETAPPSSPAPPTSATAYLTLVGSTGSEFVWMGFSLTPQSSKDRPVSPASPLLHLSSRSSSHPLSCTVINELGSRKTSI